MIDKDSVERLITELQALASSYAEHEAFAAKHAKDKTEHAVLHKELTQFRRELGDLATEYQTKRQQLGQLNADITRRGAELQRIETGIAQARQKAFGS